MIDDPAYTNITGLEQLVLFGIFDPAIQFKFQMDYSLEVINVTNSNSTPQEIIVKTISNNDKNKIALAILIVIITISTVAGLVVVMVTLFCIIK